MRSWKLRVEQTDPDKTFTVGMVYGPSGCGKSSMVKAGLLPRLSKQVLTVYVEATPEETEARLLKGLRKVCPELPVGLGLADTLAAARKGRVLPSGKKLFLVIDQFEQWLHAKRGLEDTELAGEVAGTARVAGGIAQVLLRPHLALDVGAGFGEQGLQHGLGRLLVEAVLGVRLG